jgi:hypothetical protein
VTVLLSDVSDKLSDLNSSPQGPNRTVFQRFDNVSAIMRESML